MTSGTERRPELLNKFPWPARSPDGRINVASMLDIQAWYVKNKLANTEFPAERLVDTSYVDYARGSSDRSCWRTRTARCRAAGRPLAAVGWVRREAP